MAFGAGVAMVITVSSQRLPDKHGDLVSCVPDGGLDTGRTQYTHNQSRNAAVPERGQSLIQSHCHISALYHIASKALCILHPKRDDLGF